jgi:hypothetical protein
MQIFYPKDVEVKAEQVIDRTPTKEQVTQAEEFLKAIDKETPFSDVYTMLEKEMPHVFCGSEKKELVARVHAELHPVAVEPVEEIINPK